MTKQTRTEDTTQLEGADQYRLLILIEQLQREGKSEAQISSALEEATRDTAAARLAA